MSENELRIVVLGESGVGKTSFADKVAYDTQYYRYDPFACTAGPRPPHPSYNTQAPQLSSNGQQTSPSQAFPPSHSATRMKLQVSSDLYEFDIQDISLTSRRIKEPGFMSSMIDDIVSDADGVVLLYDITNKESYTHATEFGWDYVWACKSALASRRFGCTLVGNKVDLVQGDRSVRRQVPEDLPEEWASMVGVRAFEVDIFNKSVLEDVLRDLVRHTRWAKRRDREDEEVEDERKRVTKKAEESAEETKRKSRISSMLSRLKSSLPTRDRFSAPI